MNVLKCNKSGCAYCVYYPVCYDVTLYGAGPAADEKTIERIDREERKRYNERNLGFR